MRTPTDMFTRIALLSGLLFITTLQIASAQLTVQWERLIGEDHAVAVRELSELTNGNYVISYISRELSDYEGYITKIGPNGFTLSTILWPDSVGASYLEPVDDSHVLSFYFTPNDSLRFCLISYSGVIDLISQPVLGGFGAVHPYSLNGYIVCSSYDDNEILVSRFNGDGTVVWSTSNFVGQISHANDICSSVGGNSFVSASGVPNLHLIKISPSGTLLDVYSYPSYHYVHYMDILPDGNLFLSESDEYGDGHFSGLIISPDGDLLHEYTIPEIGSMRDIWLMPDGGYLTTSFQDYNEPDLGFLLTRFDASYSQLWQYTYDNSSQDYESLDEYDVLIDRNGDILLFGNPYYIYGTEETIEFVFLSKFTPDPTDLEIAVDEYGDVSAVPAPGRFFWHGTLTNNTDADITTDVWVIVRGPDGYPSEPLRMWEDITVPANGVYEADLRQNVPADAANGEYNYIVRAGTYDPDAPQHTIQAYFPLTVTGGTEVNLDPPRTLGIVAAPFDGPTFHNPNTLRKWKP